MSVVRFFEVENTIFCYFMCIRGMGVVGGQDLVVEVWDLN